MAPGTRAEHQHHIASALHPSVEATDGTPPLSDNKKPSDDGESSKTGHELDKTEHPQGLRPWTPAPQPFDLGTYDPEGQMPQTPEPEPYDPETYAAWGRKHFGNDWYEQRKIMLQERNIYVPDPDFRGRQGDLRLLERQIEGRPLEPMAGQLDEGWQRLWARLSGVGVLPSVENGSKDGRVDGSKPASPSHVDNDGDSNDGSEQSRITGYSTFPPTPEPWSPEPDDISERLEQRRRHGRLDDEAYQYEKIFLKERLRDSVRTEREAEEGDRRLREEWEAILELRWTDNLEHQRQMRQHYLRKLGMTLEQIDAAERKAAAYKEWRKIEPREGPLTQEDVDALTHEWDATGLPRSQHAGHLQMIRQTDAQPMPDLARIFRRINRWAQTRATEPKPKPESESELDRQAKAPEPKPESDRQTKVTARKTRGGRITKSTVQVPPAQSAAKRTVQVPRQTRKRQPKVHKGRVSAAVDDSDDRVRHSKHHDTGRRTSRRLAHQPPQFGMFAKEV